MLARAAGRFVAASAIAFASVSACGVALADDFVNRVNEPFRAIRSELRSDPLVIPALAAMEPPPIAADRVERAMLLWAGAQGWNQAEAWAQGEKQQAVLRVIHDITQEQDYRVAFGFGQPYGAQGVPVAQIRSGLYTELGDPPLLAGARHLYLPAFDRAACLVHVEATRLAASGDPSAALDLLVDWTFFARQIADREFYAEVEWAMRAMRDALARMRDIAYEDSRGSGSLDPDRVKEVIDRIEERGFLGLERITLPRADLVATEQAIARVYEERGGVNRATFGTTMARLRSADRPLRLFGESAKWDAVADRQKNWFDIREELNRVGNDWTSRWTLDWNDPRMTQAFEYRGLGSFSSVIQGTLPDLSRLFELRQIVRAEAVATRHALGVYGYKLVNGQWPPTLAAIRPTWVPQLEADPFNPRRDRGAKPPLEFFVPIRDTRAQFGEREDPKPHEISIVMPEGGNFARRIGDDQFVLYSVGGNGGKDWARRVQNTGENIAGADYLAWPPVLSLQRQYLRETGQLK